MADTVVAHYGVLRRSGRYPWGSGGDNILSAIDRLSGQGLSEVEIAKGLGISTTQLRNQKALAKLQQKEAQRIFVTRQKESGMSISGIAKESNLPESTVRDLLRPGANAKFRLIKRIADVLKRAVEKFGFIDIGEGVEQFLGVTGTKLKNAVALLQNEGYTVHYLREEQLGTGKRTSIKVLAAPGVTYSEVFKNRSRIQIPNEVSNDNGHEFLSPLPIKNLDSSRIAVVQDPRKDGLIEVRDSTTDLSLGGKRYAQVRIGIDGTHYIKGVAVIDEANIPPGKDLVFYTSKPVSSDPLASLKAQNLDDPNPFGSTVRQKFYTDEEGVRQASALNVVYEEGDWSNWSKSLSSQFLSKQDATLARQQLKLVQENRKTELEEILSLTNESVKAHMLAQFADSVDADAVHLKAAALPKQTTSVLIPAPTMKQTEVYAPNYKNGEQVVLVRYPHGGVFEIPSLTVNNKNPSVKSVLGAAKDAIAIHPDVASRLSGADFDGDTVIVIPDSPRILKSPALVGLKNFDPITAYPSVPGMRVMTPAGKQMQMGIVSNLITDMTIRGATPAEIARAVRHSMVVIDAEKHQLNYQQSYIDNGIAALKTRYQGGPTKGASTIISKSSSAIRVPHRKDNYAIDPETGEKVYAYTGKTYVDRQGNEYPSTTKTTRMYETRDARTLSSGTVIEKVYADYANQMKSLGDQARLAYIRTTPKPYSPSARKTYQSEVQSLNAKLQRALRNQPLERKAQLIAGELYRAKLASTPDMSSADKRTARGRALVTARVRVGARKPLIEIEPREWEAIQMGAISPTKLTRILRNTDMDTVKVLATPRLSRGLSAGKQTRAKNLLDLGYTRAEVAASLGVSVSLLNSIDFDD